MKKILAETGLTASPAKKTKTSILKQCVTHLECNLYKQVLTGEPRANFEMRIAPQHHWSFESIIRLNLG